MHNTEYRVNEQDFDAYFKIAKQYLNDYLQEVDREIADEEFNFHKQFNELEKKVITRDKKTVHINLLDSIEIRKDFMQLKDDEYDFFYVAGNIINHLVIDDQKKQNGKLSKTLTYKKTNIQIKKYFRNLVIDFILMQEIIPIFLLHLEKLKTMDGIDHEDLVYVKTITNVPNLDESEIIKDPIVEKLFINNLKSDLEYIYNSIACAIAVLLVLFDDASRYINLQFNVKYH